MKIITRGVIVVVAAVLSAISTFALPARKGLTQVAQPDGSTIAVQIVGDEHFHYYLTEDGHLLVSKDGALYYAEPDERSMPRASAFRATDISRRSAAVSCFLQSVSTDDMLHNLYSASEAASPRRRGPGLNTTATFPTIGKQKAIVILVEYQDVKFRLSDPYDYFNRMLNEPGFSDYGGTGSARDYYLDASQGKFDPQFDVYGPVTLPEKMAYYGGNSGGNDNYNVRMMVVHACQALDAQVDFTEYDRDGDGRIDNVFLFYAGLGEASGGGADTVWPHSTDAPAGYTFDGKVLESYGCTNEWTFYNSTLGRPDGIGAFCHEFAHVLGLPDLYATSYPTPAPFTPGSWSLLDQGPYNNSGCTPPALELFSRYALNWAEPVKLESAADCTLLPIGECGNGYIIPTGEPDEYFLVENRQRIGWDSYIPGHGMLVWHVQFEPSVWITNQVNNNARHQYVDILEADNTLTEATRAGDAFPGTSDITAITSETTPALVAWSGSKINVPITEITELPDGTIKFLACGGAPRTAAVTAKAATDVTPRSFTANWEATDAALAYRLQVWSLDADNQPIYVAGYSDRQVKDQTSCNVHGLVPETTYYFSVYAENEASRSLPSENIAVTTSELTAQYVVPVALPAAFIDDCAFIANWEPVTGADDYLFTLCERKISGASEMYEDFDDKCSLWFTNSSYFYSAASYVGAAAPSLRLTDGQYVSTPVTEIGDIHTFSFWHRGREAAADTRLAIEGYANGCWGEFASYQLTTDKGGASIDVRHIPADCQAVRLILRDPSGTATAYVDDFMAQYGGKDTSTPVSGYDAMPVGNTTSLNVSGLKPGTEYCYSVVALTDGQKSMESNLISVKTTGKSGIAPVIVAAKGQIHVKGRTVSSESGCGIALYDISGRVVAASASGIVDAPSAGLYIAKSGGLAAKIVINN